MKRDSGSASVYVLGAAALVASLSLPAAVVASGFAAHRQAVLAADLAALGGAGESLYDEARACSAAARVAVANGAHLRTCVLSEGTLSVEVGVRTFLTLLPEVGAASRAGVRS